MMGKREMHGACLVRPTHVECTAVIFMGTP
jgi:hypothetical protein